MPLSGLLIFLYPVAVPLVLLLLMCKHKKQLHKGSFLFTLGIAYDAFAAKSWFFEVLARAAHRSILPLFALFVCVESIFSAL